MSKFYDITQDPEFYKTIEFIKKAENDTSILSDEQRSRLPEYNNGLYALSKMMERINRYAKRKHSSRKKKVKPSKKQER